MWRGPHSETCACGEHWFFLNIKYDQRTSEPRISGNVSRGTTQQICCPAGSQSFEFFEFDVYTKPDVPLGKLLSLYGNSEFGEGSPEGSQFWAWNLSPIGCLMIDMSNIQLEYRGTNQPLDEQLLNTAVGSIINVPEQSMQLRINYHMFYGAGIPCCLYGCVSKIATGYGDPRQNVEWLNPSRQWPLVATTGAAPGQVLVDVAEAVQPMEMARARDDHVSYGGGHTSQPAVAVVLGSPVVVPGQPSRAPSATSVEAPAVAGEPVSAAPVPPQYLCPITGEIMEDPVTTADGHAYERAAIAQWLLTHHTSPVTDAQLPHRKLAPAHALRQLIEEFVATHPAM